MDSIDFVIPLCKNNMIIRCTIESIVYNYHPKNIYIITNSKDIPYLENYSKEWHLSNKNIDTNQPTTQNLNPNLPLNPKTNIVLIDEECFFMKNYNLTRDDIERFYTFIDDNSREFGWWYQQILKLGAHKQIKNLSDPYIVWDSDLIVVQKWDLFDANDNMYKFAILQETSKNEFNKNEYAKSIKELIGFESLDPIGKGTFVPHHFIMHHNVLDNLLNFIEETHYKKFYDKKSWINIIITLSKKYYRFSEYKCLATFMHEYFPELLLFHPYNKYGKNGIRYRDSTDIIKNIQQYCYDCCENQSDSKPNNQPKKELTYEKFKMFLKKTFDFEPSYIQIEHVEVVN
jgi:hypothetical protein